MCGIHRKGGHKDATLLELVCLPAPVPSSPNSLGFMSSQWVFLLPFFPLKQIHAIPLLKNLCFLLLSRVIL